MKRPEAAASILQAGITCFYPQELCERAATTLGLSIADYSANHSATSRPFAEYPIDGELLTFLAKRSIRRHERNDDILTIADENPQSPAPGFAPSNHWNFKIKPSPAENEQPKFGLCFRFWNSVRERGVTLHPLVYGNAYLFPVDKLPNQRLFQALIAFKLPKIPRALAKAMETAEDSGNPITVPWFDMGLGGIREINDLFREFPGGVESIVDLARKDRQVFTPNPYGFKDQLFVTEICHPKLFRAWKEQLDAYRKTLCVA